MIRNTKVPNTHSRKLLMVCVAALAFNSASALAAGQSNKQKAQSSPASAYKTKKAVSPISAYKQTAPSNPKLDKELEFTIDKSMANTMNAIQWTFGASKIGRPILSGNHYQLVNLAIEQGLKRQPRTVAANLGFQDISTTNFNMLVQRQAGNGQLRYGEIVALNLKPYGWLRYKKQGSYGGINLGDDDDTPHYIWQIVGGEKGKKVYSGMPFALYNTKPVMREVIFCPRASGIDLGWRGKSDCDSELAKISGKVFGANGALSGDGLTGKIAMEWKNELCTAAVGAASAYVTAQTGGVAAAGVATAGPAAIKKCNSY